MANDGLFADVRDKLLETLDTDEALTAWLTAHNGHKYFCRPTDKLALDLVALNCPAIIIKPAGTILGYATNAWMQAILTNGFYFTTIVFTTFSNITPEHQNKVIFY